MSDLDEYLLDDFSSFDNDRQPRIRACRRQPPLYQVDMSQPPRTGYAQICTDYAHEMRKLVGIYDALLASTPAPRVFRFLAKVLLTKVFSKEETEEIKGIALNTNMPLHLIVAYNAFLDLFSGCMSGGTRVAARGRTTKMIHFRNLDWDMEPLRDMVIRVEYLIGKSRCAKGAIYLPKLLRPDPLQILDNQQQGTPPSHTAGQATLHLLTAPPNPSLPRFASNFRLAFRRVEPHENLIMLPHLCTPSAVLVVEKDLNSAVPCTSDMFLAVTNHDAAMESWFTHHWRHFMEGKARSRLTELSSARDVMEDSIDRKSRMCSLWRAERDRSEKIYVSDVKKWLRTYPIRNECTHFCFIMDPSVQGGGLTWVEACEVH